MILFFAVCSCQMYQRVKWEVEGDRGKRPMPMAPYDRDLNIVWNSLTIPYHIYDNGFNDH